MIFFYPGYIVNKKKKKKNMEIQDSLAREKEGPMLVL